jgi:ketosteroid isomerase-like protein
MSQENVELVRSALEVGAARGFDAVSDLCDPNIECSPPANSPTAGTFRGLDEIRALISEWRDQFEDFGFDPERLVDAGDRVVVFGHQHGRGRASGVDISESQVHVYTLRDGRILRWQMFHDPRLAFEAAGLSGQDADADTDT